MTTTVPNRSRRGMQTRRASQQYLPKLKPIKKFNSMAVIPVKPMSPVLENLSPRTTQSPNKGSLSNEQRGLGSVYLSRTSTVVDRDNLVPLRSETVPKEGSEDPGGGDLNRNVRLPPIQKEFTFTGYDIMADTEPLEDTKSEKTEILQLYLASCRQTGVTPISQFVTQIGKPRLSIKGRPMTEKDTRALCIALTKVDSVTSVDLRDNSIGPEGAECLTTMLRENTTITHLNLAENKIGARGAKVFSELIQDGRHLHTLDLSGCDLQDTDAKQVAEIIEHSHILRCFNISHNRFEVSGALEIGRAIAINDTLQDLDISWNHIRGQGTLAIALGVKRNVALKKLNISWNGFATRGSVGLGGALAENRTLVELDVSNNRIGAKGIAAILKGLQRNEGLKILRIGNNPYDPDVALTILLAIDASPSCVLTTLDLTDIVVRSEFLVKWEEIKNKRVLPLRIMFGEVIKTVTKSNKDNNSLDWRDPVIRMYKHMQDQGYRVIDLMKTLDKDRNFSVDRQEFKTGLKSVNIPLTESQLDQIIDRLDTDGDGEVDFGELIAGEKEFKRKLYARKRRMLHMANVADDVISRLINIDQL